MEPQGSLPHLQVPATYPCRESDQSSVYPPSHFLKIRLRLSSHLCLGLLVVLSLRVPHHNPVYTTPLPRTCYMSRPSHSSRYDHRLIFGEEYRSFSSSLCSFLHSPVTSSVLGPNILLSTLFSDTLNLSSSLSVSDQVSHP